MRVFVSEGGQIVKKILQIIALVCALAVTSYAAAPPSLFFTDYTSGPNTGGEAVAGYSGVYVTLYGNNFGSSQGSSTVTLNGANCLRVVEWGTPYQWYQKIVVQLGATCSTGDFSVITADGVSSSPSVVLNGQPTNPALFTVRAGRIFFVSTSGNDGNVGSFASPFKSLTKCRDTEADGDLCYAENGVSQTGQDNYASNLVLKSSCSVSTPCGIGAYPDATVTVGSDSDQNRGVYFYGGSNWTIAGLTIRATEEAFQNNGDSNVRLVANDLQCVNGSGQDACVHAEGAASGIAFYGNYLHNTGTHCGSDCKEYHAFYMSTNTNHVDVGWNLIVPNPAQTSQAGCRAVQFYSTGGSDQYDLHVHDNVIHDAICDGINFSTVDADKGTVEAYNNVVYHVGTGPDPNGNESNYTCLNASSSGTPSASVNIYNNTFYDCG